MSAPPIRRATAARLGLRRRTPSAIIRIRRPVSEATLRNLELRFAARVRAGGYVFLRHDEPDPPVLRAAPYRRPWWRALLSRSRW